MTCSRCADNQAVPGQKWCRNCRALYQRQYRTDIKSRSFRRGAETLRSALIAAFAGIGPAELNGYTAVEIVRNLELRDVP